MSENINEFSLKVRISTLAFVPLDGVKDAYENLVEDFEGNDRTTPFLDYLEDKFIGWPTRRRNGRPERCLLGLWNVHERVENVFP